MRASVDPETAERITAEGATLGLEESVALALLACTRAGA